MAEAIREYFGHVTDVVKTFWEGLSVTLSYMVRRPITTQYPDRTPKRVADMLPSRYRGLLEVDIAVCSGCMACERACPIEVIKISTDKDPQNPKQRLITQFDIDMSKCMFCGLCVEQCPTGSIKHTREFEATRKSIDALVMRWVPDPEKPAPFYRPVKGQDAPRAPVGEILKQRLAAASWIERPRIFPDPEGAGAGPGTLVGAAAVALSRNIFWSAMGLLASLVGVGGMYVLLSADFVAITQLLIYIGGVLVLIIFAIMLTSQIQDINVSNRSVGLVGGYALFFVVSLLLSFVALWAPWRLTSKEPIANPTTALGDGLLGTWLLPFEIASVVLVATLVGAIVIARKEVKSDS
jgi:formate hydrogenlyase subunit 6/NADH:ubiquinone oxidoreductase subunit I/NADH:ubiquinone oxidoreductase subunit 6 (subunit J)